MSESLFNAEILPVLSSPAIWRLVSSCVPGEVAASSDEVRCRWSSEHTHAHAYRELLIALRGESWYGLRGKLYPCQPGTIILFDPHEPHDLGYPPSADQLSHLWMVILPAQLFVRYVRVNDGEYASETPTWVLQESPEATLLHDACEWARSHMELAPAARRLRLIGAISHVLSAVAELDAREGAGQREGVQESAVDAVCKHLRETAGRGASLETLARMAGYSKFHFLRIFKARTGLTVQSYIDRCRLLRVRELQHQGYTQQAIAGELGFASASSFSRWLRQHSRP